MRGGKMTGEEGERATLRVVQLQLVRAEREEESDVAKSDQI